jgi:hypothetical protein
MRRIVFPRALTLTLAGASGVAATLLCPGPSFAQTQPPIAATRLYPPPASSGGNQAPSSYAPPGYNVAPPSYHSALPMPASPPPPPTPFGAPAAPAPATAPSLSMPQASTTATATASPPQNQPQAPTQLAPLPVPVTAAPLPNFQPPPTPSFPLPPSANPASPPTGTYNPFTRAPAAPAPTDAATRPNIWLPRGTAVLQTLDKSDAVSATMVLKVGQSGSFGTLKISLNACVIRPPDQPSDAAAFLTITDSHPDEPGFKGWMMNAEPTASMLEHPIYDVRVIGCT